MRIHLLCDQKWRDLPNLAALKLLLEQLGHRVLLSTTKDQHQMIRAFRPDCVVFNHLFAPANQQLARDLRASGVAVVVLPTEGAVRPELMGIADGEFAKDWSMDLFLAWSAPAADGVRRRWGLDEGAVPVVGCTRFDFYTDRFRCAITPREVFCQHHRLDPARPIVTWATAFGFAGLQHDSVRYARFLAECEANGLATCYRRIGVDPRRVPELFEQGRTRTCAAFVRLAKARPDVQFIIRPHPVDDRGFYRAVIENNGLTNVRFCPKDYIWNVLNASHVHLHRHCTTAVEAWMWDKPTIEMAVDNVREWQWPDREVGSAIVHDASELVDRVDSFLSGRSVEPEIRDYRRGYIETWFGPQDGRRCVAAANAIDGLMSKIGRRRRFITGIASTPTATRSIATAVLRHVLGKRPNEPLLRWTSVTKLDPMDKLATRGEVMVYQRLIADAVAGEARR
ncbi:MAG: hypothetical protein HC829_00300 [Bacteroidales bacterium]|nr:hypothetical protein [Bacteroidales bacterium]